jgi:hypothetical protein
MAAGVLSGVYRTYVMMKKRSRPNHGRLRLSSSHLVRRGEETSPRDITVFAPGCLNHEPNESFHEVRGSWTKSDASPVGNH